MRRAIRQLLVLAAILAVLPAAAAADAPDDAIRDCMADGAVQGTYSDTVLQLAITRISGDRAVYGDCAAVLGSLIGASGGPKAKASGKKAAAGADGDEKLTPAEKRARVRQAKEKRKRQIASVDDIALDTSGDPLQIDEASGGGMPLPLLLTLILLACLAVGGGVWYAARRNPAFANALRRVPLPGRRG